MLTSDKLILVELHKAGSARLKKLLGDVVGGETSAKHSGYSDALAAHGKPVVGYLCNPLTWYLSQWQLGCTGKGDIHKRLTDQTKWDWLHSKRSNLTPKEGQKPDAKAIPENWNAAHAKNFWYADAENPEAFREWLQAVLSNRGLRRLVDHGYANSPVNRLAGLMTFHFFLLFVRNAENMEKSVDSMDALKALYDKQAITSHFIRSEAISADLRRTLETLGVALSSEQRAAIDALKERTGSDDAAIVKFYDAASLRLVAKRETFLNELFGYGPPSAEARAAIKVAKAEKRAGKAQGEGKPEGKAAKAVKSTKAEREQKRAERAARQAAKATKSSERAAKPKVDKPAKAKPEKPQAEKPAKPQKVARVRNKPADDDVIDNEE
jgi:hypothetical protein